MTVLLANIWAWGFLRNDVLNVAYSYPDGGGYCALNDSGVSHTIRYDGSVILPASKGGSYCCGFTFMVAMRVAEERGLLAGKSVDEVRRFQREWYGSEKGAASGQCVAAVVDLGVGHEIAPEDARAGDFIVFDRTTKIGHSVVFLDWMRDRAGKIRGLHYRSSQSSSRGIGDSIEYFADSGIGHIDRQTVRIARLNRGAWGRLFHPFN
jgi:hypothetical protein